MEVQVNWVAVLVATLGTMFVGGIWYSPPVMGKTWMKLIGKKQNELPSSWTPIVFGVIGGFVTSFVLAHFIYLADNFYSADYSFLATSLITAVWAWLGFTLARFFTHYSFEGRTHKLTLVNGLHELVTFLVIGLIIGLFGV